MRIFVSYSFKTENAWIEQYVIPLIRCFGHEPETGRILDTGPLGEEVKRKIRLCRRVICFTTRASPRYNSSAALTGYDAPQWVEDELMLARGGDQAALEFRERDVVRTGASNLYPYVEFDRENVPALLIELAERIKEWPIGPLNLKLEAPAELRTAVEQAANAGTLVASIVVDEGGQTTNEDLKVRVQNGHLIVPFWLKPNPNQSIEIEIALGAQRLVSRGISPSVRNAPLTVV